MSIVTLKSPDSSSTARISTDRGFNCFDFVADFQGMQVQVLDSVADYGAGGGEVNQNGIPILFPFPNRIRAGRFTWNGREYHLPESSVGYDNTGNAIHGFVIDRAWRVVEQGDSFVTGEFQLSVDAPERRELWPADFILRCRYEVTGSSLRSKFEVLNPDSVALPWGLGTHAYFRLPLSDASRADQCLLVAPVTRQWSLTDCLPDGATSELSEDLPLAEGVYFGMHKLDDVFSGVPNDVVECSIIDESAGVQMTQRNPGSFRELVLYTPPNRDAVCFEPYTCVTDAVNLEQKGVDAGWQILEPGEQRTTWIDLEVGPIIA